jgi:ATP-dependent DNA helicase RecG
MEIEFNTHIQYLKGVGPKLGHVLMSRGVGTVGELLEWFPRTYEDRRRARNISSLTDGQIVSLRASITNVRSVPLGRTHRKMYEVTIGDSSGRISCKYFRVPYKGYFERFTSGQSVRISGKVILYRGRLEFHHPDIQPIFSEEDDSPDDILIPLYTETEGLSAVKLRKLMGLAISELVEKKLVPEVYPAHFRTKYNLMSRAQALKEIHAPIADLGEDYLQFRTPAQRRIIFDEFFWLELHMALQKKGFQQESAPAFLKGATLAEKLEKSLPFQLTGAQKRVFEEIVLDLKKPHPMHRLVQGDVGSGKTMVAMLSACVASESGYQTAIMAPTEILAEQHFKNALKLFTPLGKKVEMITGKLTEKEHREACARVLSGQIDIIIGTHALIEDEVQFKNLGLVVIDEQHRFGVDQRQKLKKKQSPHFLVMTATPIPRTLAMTVYGDLDVSVVDEMPPGRSPIVTRKTFSSKRNQVFDFMAEQIEKGRQAYVVYPLVEESEKIDLKDAVSEFEKLSAEYPKLRIGLLHGKMKADEKDAVMNQYRAHEIDVLVSTTVIEVGVDVPNANIIIIEHAERFGLSQLHQLRGRVGRGAHKSYCVLLLGYAVSEEAIERAGVIEGTTDGFKIAEADLEMRGPGEFLGRRQSGLPGFKLANLVRDIKILQEARDAAIDLVNSDPKLSKAENALIRQELKKAVLLFGTA